MAKRDRILRLIVCSLSIVVLILDSKTALLAAQDGINICIKTIIPAVFPFMFIGKQFISIAADLQFRPIERLLRLPPGSSGYFLCGLFCGYPVGAKLIHDGFLEHRLSKEDSTRMICFCNNASPAFVIGILSSLFSSCIIGFAAWLIQILCAICTGFILPAQGTTSTTQHSYIKQSEHDVMLDILRSVANVCGWVILFKLILAYLHRWFLWILPQFTQVFLSGILELTNGLCMLEYINSDALRFVMASVMLALGGFCVLLQTHGVAPTFQMSYYFLGKLMYAALAACLSSISACFLFSTEKILLTTALLSAVIIAILGFLLFLKKKVVAIDKNIVYNHCYIKG